MFCIEVESMFHKFSLKYVNYGQFYVYTTHTNWPYCGWPGSRRTGLEVYAEVEKVEIEDGGKRNGKTDERTGEI